MSKAHRGIVGTIADYEGLGGWLLVGCMVAYIVGVTWWQVVPVGPGIGFLPAWLALVAAAATLAEGVARRHGRHLRPLEAGALVAAPAMVLTDLYMSYQPLRDLGIYLKAGQHFLAGNAIYIQSQIDVRPSDLSNYPFLYPPLTLPFFGAMSLLPEIVAQAIWAGGSVALGVAALRVMGLRWRWAFLAILWPPLFQGLWVGNVAVPALALFALAPRFGGGLVMGAIFKSYTGIAALWLVRERRWSDLVAGIGLVMALVVVTVPLTGTKPWLDWIQGLRLYQISQERLPVLYGFGLMKFLPLWIAVAFAAASVVVALRAPGREGLARLGTATIVASPSLWGHGILVAVPSLLYLRPAWLWLGIAIVSVPDGIQWWWLIVLIAASWLLPGLRRSDRAAHPAATPESPWLDPLAGGASGPWPGLPDRSPGTIRWAGASRRLRLSGSASESGSVPE
jgi:hypothetical protein